MISLSSYGNATLIGISPCLDRGNRSDFDGWIFLSLLGRPFLLMIDGKVAVLADTLSIESSVTVLALVRLLSSSSSVVAVLTHAVGIV